MRTIKKTIDYFFLGNTINFAYTDFDTGEKFETIYKDKKWQGAFGMWACLKRAVENKIDLLDARFLELLDRKSMRQIFTGNIEIPMVDERLAIWHETAKILKEKYRGSFYNLAKKSRFYCFDNGKGIVERLAADFPSFNDVSCFKGNEIKFYKRAQLAVAMAYERLRQTNLFPVKDINELTVFADYCLPVSLNELGILRYDKNLEEKIANRKLIKKDSREELEIRAATIWTTHYLQHEVETLDKKVNSLEIDYFLWSKGKDSKKKHHLCKTIAY